MNKFLSILAALLIVLAIVVKALPQMYRFGIGGHYHRLDFAFWPLLVAGVILGVIAAIKIMRPAV